MASKFALINKDTLNFICNGKGVTIEFLAQKTSCAHDNIIRWLDVKDKLLPTINQAKTLAACLHIPFAALYMNASDIPIKAIPSFKNMRTIMNIACVDDSAINIAIIDILTAYDFLIETSNELGIPNILYIESPTIDSNDPYVWATEIRKYLDLKLDDQFNLSSSRKFYLYLRSKVETKGIFVQCFNGVPVETARGFALFNKNHPIIGLNADDRYPAKSFSIIHELVHIIKHESSLCNDNFSSFSALSEEIFCNAVAGELLVPFFALNILLKNEKYNTPYTIKDIQSMADKFSVSKEVIVRRLLDNGNIDRNAYDSYNSLFKIEIERLREQNKLNRENGLPTSFPRSASMMAIDRTSASICNALYLGYASDLYSKFDLANYLGIKLDKVSGFLKEVAVWNS